MFIGKVTDNLVATIKIPEHKGRKLMLVRKVSVDGEVFGPEYVALDGACAGINDFVLFTLEGGAANMIMEDIIKANSTIVGVLDFLPETAEGK